ncbi:MAG: mechanosensitive ion channel family protein [Candidatus Kapaibacterium sp.]
MDRFYYNWIKDTFFANEYLGNMVIDYAFFLLLFIFGIIALKIARRITLKISGKLLKKRDPLFYDYIDNVSKKYIAPMEYLAAFYFSFKTLSLNSKLESVIDVSALIVLTIFLVLFLIALIDFLVRKYIAKQDDSPRRLIYKSLRPAIGIAMWTLGLVFLLSNLGFEISALIAALGVGGIAIALAAQAVLGDLFSYMVIVMDKPFELGDFIIVGDFLGVVEHVGIKTTKIRSLGGEQLIFANSDLTSSRIRNYKRMEMRRVLFQFGVLYQTPAEKVKLIPEWIKTMIESIDDTKFDRAHFHKYGDYSLNYEVVYYIQGNDYNKYMDIQQEINFQMFDKFESEGVEFAFPTRTLLFDNKHDDAIKSFTELTDRVKASYDGNGKGGESNDSNDKKSSGPKPKNK